MAPNNRTTQKSPPKKHPLNRHFSTLNDSNSKEKDRIEAAELLVLNYGLGVFDQKAVRKLGDALKKFREENPKAFHKLWKKMDKHFYLADKGRRSVEVDEYGRTIEYIDYDNVSAAKLLLPLAFDEIEQIKILEANRSVGQSGIGLELKQAFSDENKFLFTNHNKEKPRSYDPWPFHHGKGPQSITEVYGIPQPVYKPPVPQKARTTNNPATANRGPATKTSKPEAHLSKEARYQLWLAKKVAQEGSRNLNDTMDSFRGQIDTFIQEQLSQDQGKIEQLNLLFKKFEGSVEELRRAPSGKRLTQLTGCVVELRQMLSKYGPPDILKEQINEISDLCLDEALCNSAIDTLLRYPGKTISEIEKTGTEDDKKDMSNLRALFALYKVENYENRSHSTGSTPQIQQDHAQQNHATASVQSPDLSGTPLGSSNNALKQALGNALNEFNSSMPVGHQGHQKPQEPLLNLLMAGEKSQSAQEVAQQISQEASKGVNREMTHVRGQVGCFNEKVKGTKKINESLKRLEESVEKLRTNPSEDNINQFNKCFSKLNANLKSSDHEEIPSKDQAKIRAQCVTEAICRRAIETLDKFQGQTVAQIEETLKSQAPDITKAALGMKHGAEDKQNMQKFRIMLEEYGTSKQDIGKMKSEPPSAQTQNLQQNRSKDGRSMY